MAELSSMRPLADQPLIGFGEIIDEIDTVHRMCMEALEASLPRDMSLAQFQLLRCLETGKRRITDIAESLTLSQPSASDIVKRVHAKGWVTIRVLAADRRQRVVALSAVGRRKLIRAQTRCRAVTDKMNRKVEQDLIINLHTDLCRVRARLDRILS